MSMPAIRAAAALRNLTAPKRLICPGGRRLRFASGVFTFGAMCGGDVKLLAAFGGACDASPIYWRVWRNRMRQGGMAQGEFIPNAPAIVSVAGLTLWAN